MKLSITSHVNAQYMKLPQSAENVFAQLLLECRTTNKCEVAFCSHISCSIVRSGSDTEV